MRICEILDKIERNLPPEMQQLVFDLDDVMMEQGGITSRVMYRQGLFDRFNLERFWLRILEIFDHEGHEAHEELKTTPQI